MVRRTQRDFIGVIFKCCKKYGRAYINKSGTAYVGWCPRCAKQVRFNISADGSRERFFEAT